MVNTEKRDTNMAQKSKTQKTHKTQTTQNAATEMADQARQSYQQAVRTGQQLHEEAGQWWSRMLGQAASAGEWQKYFANMTSAATSMLPLTQQRMEDVFRFVEKSSRTGNELIRKAVDAAQSTAVAEGQAKWMDFWAYSMKAVQANVETVTEMSTRAFDGWMEFIRKSEARAA